MKFDTSNILSWLPRVLGILFALFLVLFSFDVIEPGVSVPMILVGFFMHNIPVLILVSALIYSRKNELVSGIVFILMGILYIASLWRSSSFEWYMISWSIIIAGPAILIGALFLYSWRKKQ